MEVSNKANGIKWASSQKFFKNVNPKNLKLECVSFEKVPQFLFIEVGSLYEMKNVSFRPKYRHT
jgi:hypothetical protein